jgi:hypothetical protein
MRRRSPQTPDESAQRRATLRAQRKARVYAFREAARARCVLALWDALDDLARAKLGSAADLDELIRLTALVEQRRAELRRIESLMMRDTAGRDGRRRLVRQEAGAIDIPLGETAARWKKSRKALRLPEGDAQ